MISIPMIKVGYEASETVKNSLRIYLMIWLLVHVTWFKNLNSKKSCTLQFLMKPSDSKLCWIILSTHIYLKKSLEYLLPKNKFPQFFNDSKSYFCFVFRRYDITRVNFLIVALGICYFAISLWLSCLNLSV